MNKPSPVEDAATLNLGMIRLTWSTTLGSAFFKTALKSPRNPACFKSRDPRAADRGGKVPLSEYEMDWTLAISVAVHQGEAEDADYSFDGLIGYFC